MRSPAEIKARIAEVQGADLFGSKVVDLVYALPWADAKPYLVDDATEDKFNADATPTDESVHAEIVRYLAFAWEKALDHRGLSAARSIEHMRAWLWLLGDHELLAVTHDDDRFPQYGAPILAAISRKYGAAIPEGDRAARMIAGDKCCATCNEGCGQ